MMVMTTVLMRSRFIWGRQNDGCPDAGSRERLDGSKRSSHMAQSLTAP
jgi:hypothetical protein